MITKRSILVFILLVIGIAIGWYLFNSPMKQQLPVEQSPTEQTIVETPPVRQTPTEEPFEATFVEIELDGPITKKKAEISGMTWVGNTLVLLPQYPEEFGDPGILYTIPKQAILDYLDDKVTSPIIPDTIDLVMPNFKDEIKDYEGFESIGYYDNNIFLTMESGKNENMMGYLIKGVLSNDRTEVVLDPTSLTRIKPPIELDNRTDEAMIIFDDMVYTFFEVNGENFNPSPASHVFDINMQPLGTVSFPHIDYRVTDAAISSNGDIWMINQAAPKDEDIIPTRESSSNEADSQVTTEYIDHVEQLIKLIWEQDGFVLDKTPAIQIKFDDEPRNWEGLAILDNRGFLLVTDKSPDTIFGFVPMP